MDETSNSSQLSRNPGLEYAQAQRLNEARAANNLQAASEKNTASNANTVYDEPSVDEYPDDELEDDASDDSNEETGGEQTSDDSGPSNADKAKELAKAARFGIWGAVLWFLKKLWGLFTAQNS